MDEKVLFEKQDLTHLVWSRYRHSSGTAGSFLKAYETKGGTKVFYKLSAYDSVRGIYGHECINEIIADRLLTLFDIEHVPYRLIHADVNIEDKVYDTVVCASDDFKHPGEKKVAFDIFYELNRNDKESPIAFCDRIGWRDEIDKMLFIDYLILNRDRHGANIDVLKDAKHKTVRLAPLYDHGLSLLFSCITRDEVQRFDMMEDKRVQCFAGSSSAWENLKLIKGIVSEYALKKSDRAYVFFGLEEILPDYLREAIWKMIWKRWKAYEDMQNSR